MKRFLSSLLFEKIWGWKIENIDWSNIPKAVVPTLPHTSNWDFPIGILLRPIIRQNIQFAAKDSLFKFPFGWLMRALGGYPIDRSGNLNYVQAVTKIFDENEHFLLCVAPEGTRTKVPRLKTGFYYIAVQAKVPLVCCKFDWENKIVGFREPFYPSGNFDEDIKILQEFYKGVKGKIPEYGWDGVQRVK